MKSIAIAALLGHISAQEFVPIADENDTLFNPQEESLEDLNKPEPTTPCCHDCTEPLEKYYSVDKLHGNCGEACMDPKQFWLYKIFEPALAKDDSSNTPCLDRGFDDYQYTPTHGAGPIKMTLDLYGPHKDEGIFHDAQDDCEKLSSENKCHSDKTCSWCVSAAVASKCNSVDVAKTLPSAVFQCDNLEFFEDVAAECESNTSADSCDSKDECSWCMSAAVPSACHSLDDAKALPSAVFQCDKVEMFEEPADECEGLGSQDDCDAKDECSWCKSAAVKSACKSFDVAKSLPSAVFQCDKI